MHHHVIDWLHLALRWAHIVFGIAWIGSSFYFMWLDSSLAQPDPPRDGVKGELWMVHSGGFYRVEKRIIGPGTMPGVLHWFKYEALFTWITGIVLLFVVYYTLGGLYLIDKRLADIGVHTAMLINLGVLAGSWLVYDLIWRSPLASAAQNAVASVLSSALLVGLAWGLGRIFTPRGAFIHVGAVMGTIMVMNVWMRILPGQSKMIAATKEGKQPDLTLGERAKRRSVHNNYMTLPVIFIMISNHFPVTYGWKYPWVILTALMVASAGVRHIFNIRGGRGSVPIGLAAAAIIAAMFVVTLPPSRKRPPVVQANGAGLQGGGNGAGTQPSTAKPIDPSTVGAIKGVVLLEGTPPPRTEQPLPGECAQAAAGAVLTENVVAQDGKLANVFVWIKKGAEAWQPPPAQGEVTVDQHGCTYRPHVVGVRVGQPLTFVNSDQFLHNIHAVSNENDEFNVGMQVAERVTRTFDAPEVMLRMKCDVHAWMSAHIGIVPHPWFAVTAADGTFELAAVPPGDYVIEAWHEQYGTKEQTVKLDAKGAAAADFTFTVH